MHNSFCTILLDMIDIIWFLTDYTLQTILVFVFFNY